MISWTAHTYYSSPGRHAALIAELPAGAVAACEAARNVIGHYGTDFVDLPVTRRDEVNSRSLRRILDADQSRSPYPLAVPRDSEMRVPGCCRDHAQFVVGVLREQGTPARTRIGFADYLVPEQRVDHVIVEYWDTGRWIRTDPEMRPGSVAFDPADMEAGPDAPFQTAAEAWQAFRLGRIDFDHYQIPPGSAFSDSAHVLRTYVAFELAHLNRDELLLWDIWPGIEAFDDAFVDEVADTLVKAESEGDSVDAELTGLYEIFGPGGVVTQLSPYGYPPQQVMIESERFAE